MFERPFTQSQALWFESFLSAYEHHQMVERQWNNQAASLIETQRALGVPELYIRWTEADRRLAENVYGFFQMEQLNKRSSLAKLRLRDCVISMRQAFRVDLIETNVFALADRYAVELEGVA
jgi:hypothetical protein